MLLKRRAVRLALKELANGADDAREIANRLKAAGVKGGHRPDNCPVAHYLKQKTGLKVSVGPGTVTNDWVTRVPIWTPSKVSVFIELYDNGYYRELEGYQNPWTRES